MLFFQIAPTASLLALPLLLVFMLLFSAGLGLLLSALAVFFRDVCHLWGVVITAWTYATPLFYPLGILPEWMQSAELFNPTFHYVTYFRSIVMSGTIPGCWREPYLPGHGCRDVRDWLHRLQGEREKVHPLRVTEVPMSEAINTSPLQDRLDDRADAASEQTIVKVSNVSMIFNMASEQLNSLKEYAIALAKRELRFKEFRALDDVSFEVKKGDVFGILGTNGSGKSTMLKIVAGVLEPSEGTCSIHGNIAPLIELGAGFRPRVDRPRKHISERRASRIFQEIHRTAFGRRSSTLPTSRSSWGYAHEELFLRHGRPHSLRHRDGHHSRHPDRRRSSLRWRLHVPAKMRRANHPAH